MKLKFLCSDCLSWLNKNPSVIPQRCHDAYKAAAVQYREGDLDKALQNIGAAFEMSEIMINTNGLTHCYASDWLITTSEVLVRILGEMDRFQDSIDIHQRTVFLLNKKRNQPVKKKWIPKLVNKNTNYLSVVH